MDRNQLRAEAQNPYESLIKGKSYLILLISSTVAVTLSILGNGIAGIISQIIPLIILIGLYMARSYSRTGVKMVQVCAAIIFWMNCILSGLLLGGSILIMRGAMSSSNDTSGGLVAIIAVMVAVFLMYFFPILYNRDIQLIAKDVWGWFITDGKSDGLPPESRKRVSCKLVVLCVIQLIISGAAGLYSLAMYTRSGFFSSISGMLLSEITGDSSASQLVKYIMPGTSILSVISQAAVIAKLVCVILLYRQYREIVIKPQVKPIPVPDPVPKPVAAPAPKPAAQPAKRRVKIILERKAPREGRFSASMTSEMVVGRHAEEAKLVVDDDQAISGRHMKLTIRDNKLYAEDLGSHNGVYVNGRKIQGRQQIHRGDEIRLGNSVFTLKWEA